MAAPRAWRDLAAGGSADQAVTDRSLASLHGDEFLKDGT
jgi:hypothetical protein